MLIHKADIDFYNQCKEYAFKLSDSIEGGLKAFEPKRRPSSCGADGLCYTDEKRISIVFRYKEGGEWFNKPLLRSEVLRTVAHEVAHLIHANHSKEFRQLEKDLIKVINNYK
jgi:hypothetical protein